MYLWTDGISGYVPEVLAPYLTDDILYTMHWINRCVLAERRLVLKTIECDSWIERSKEPEHQEDLWWDAYNDAVYG